MSSAAMRTALLWFFVVLAWIAALVYAQRVSAEGAFGVPAALDLARICAGEAGAQPSADCPAIFAVLTRRADARDMSWRRMARTYSDRHFDRSRQDARRWVAFLRPDDRRPRGWPDSASWRRRRHDWAALYRQAERIVSGDLQAPCEPDDWGCESDLPRYFAAYPEAERVECGTTLNTFLKRP